MVASLSFCLSFLYFLRSAAICGCSDDIARVVCICLMNSGTISSRIRATRMMMVSAQVQPLVGPKGTFSTS